MAKKLVFNPFTGTFDIIDESAGGGGLTTIQAYCARNNANQNVNGVTEVAFQVEVVTDAGIITKSGNQFTCKKNGKYLVFGNTNCEGNGVAFATERTGETWVERADGGAFSMVQRSINQQNWNAGAGGGARGFSPVNALLIDDAVADVTVLRLIGNDPSGTDFQINANEASIIIVYLGE